jgi:hypothetical protein
VVRQSRSTETRCMCKAASVACIQILDWFHYVHGSSSRALAPCSLATYDPLPATNTDNSMALSHEQYQHRSIQHTRLPTNCPHACITQQIKQHRLIPTCHMVMTCTYPTHGVW